MCACENVCDIRANGAYAMLRYVPRCDLGLLHKFPFVFLMLPSYFDIT